MILWKSKVTSPVNFRLFLWYELYIFGQYLVEYEVDHKKDGVRANLLKRDQAKIEEME